MPVCAVRLGNNKDGNKFMIFSGIAMYYGDTCTYIPVIAKQHGVCLLWTSFFFSLFFFFFFFCTLAVFKCRLPRSVEIECKGTVPLYPLSPLDILSTPLLPNSKMLFST